LLDYSNLFDMPMPENAKREIGDTDSITSASKKANIDTFSAAIHDWIMR